MKCALWVAAIFWIAANCEAADDLKTLIIDAANDFHDAKGELNYSSDGHESYDSKLELSNCEDPSIWKRPNGDLEFTCEIVPNNESFDAVSSLLAERVKSIQAELPPDWKTKIFPDAKPYEDFFIARDSKLHLELNIHIVPYQDNSFDAVLNLVKIFTKPSTPDSLKEAQMKLKKKGIEFTPENFLKKVTEGDLNSVQLFLDAGIDPDSLNDEKSSALIIAAQMGFSDIVTQLLDHGASANLKNIFGEDAIFEAVDSRSRCFFNRGLDSESAPECNQTQFDFFDIVQNLLDRDADPNAKDKVGNSVLFFANNDPEIAELLLNNGVDVNLKNDQGRTVLIDAASANDLEFVKLLLKHKADRQIKDNNGKTALDYATEQKSKEIIKLLTSS